MHASPLVTGTVAWTRSAAVGCAVALVLLCMAWELWLAPTGQGTLAIKAVPAALALPGLWRMRLYTYRWVSLAVWLYVCEGLVRATSEHGTGAALACGEVAIALALFTACGAHVRARLRNGAMVAS